MPYAKASDLPAAFGKYSEAGKKAALGALNGVLLSGGSESEAFATAHKMAKRAMMHPKRAAKDEMREAMMKKGKP